MNCREILNQLSEFLDGELDPALAEALKKHLGACPDCKVVVDTTKKTVELYCGTEPLELPADVGERLQQALATKLKPTSS